MTNNEAINLLRGLEQSLDGYCELNDEGKKAFNMAVSALELFGNAEQLPSAQPEIRTQMSSANCISRQAAIDAISSMFAPIPSQKDMVEDCLEIIKNLPPAQPVVRTQMSSADDLITLYGYNIEHLKMIAEVLRKENLPPERVTEALTDIGRIASIIRAEFEEELRKAVERCMI